MITSTLILVGYNRPDFLKNRLEELRNLNVGSYNLEVFIDGPKNSDLRENSYKMAEIIDEYSQLIEMN